MQGLRQTHSGTTPPRALGSTLCVQIRARPSSPAGLPDFHVASRIYRYRETLVAYRNSQPLAAMSGREAFLRAAVSSEFCDVSNQELDCTGAAVLAEALSRNPRVTDLRLACTRGSVMRQWCHRITSASSPPPPPPCARGSGNKFGPIGASAMAGVLRGNTTLASIYIAGTCRVLASTAAAPPPPSASQCQPPRVVTLSRRGCVRSERHRRHGGDEPRGRAPGKHHARNPQHVGCVRRVAAAAS